jgi:hypothetical protein
MNICRTKFFEYGLRFDADEEYVRELIDRIDEMSLRGGKPSNRRTDGPLPVLAVDQFEAAANRNTFRSKLRTCRSGNCPHSRREGLAIPRVIRRRTVEPPVRPAQSAKTVPIG